MSADLLDIDKRILQILSNQPSRSAKGIANECEISVRTVERYLKALQLKGKLQRVGATKGDVAGNLNDQQFNACFGQR